MTAPARPPAVPRVSCAACGNAIRRSTGLTLCKPCSAKAWRIFEASVAGVDPNTYQQRWFAFYGGRNAPAISAARQARAVAV